VVIATRVAALANQLTGGEGSADFATAARRRCVAAAFRT
jgi:hypothetical protein